MMVEEMFSLAGRRAVVTGGSSGIGHGMAQALADAGARVHLVARDPERLRVAAADMGAVFLASDASAFLTGQAIAVDGGFSVS